MAFYNDLKLHLEAGVPAIYVESSEWLRFEREIAQCCKETGKELLRWSSLDGLMGGADSTGNNHRDFVELVEYLHNSAPKDAVFVLESPVHRLKDDDVASMFVTMLRGLRGKGSHVIIFSSSLDIPEMSRREFAVLSFPLPGREDIRKIMQKVGKDHNVDKGMLHTEDAIVDSVRGLGATEIWNAFSKVAVSVERITAEEIGALVAEKEQIIRKSGYLEFVRTDKMDMDKIGGLESLKKWLEVRKKGFGGKARKAGLAAPKGVLLLGVPGTGKSLCAKVVSYKWKMPLLRLDMGRIFGSGVGESESNIRNAIKVAEGLAPCVLWIDEIEKGVSGGAGASGEQDGGTAVRVFGTFLTWMQEKEKEVFVFATANDLSRLPPELLRKGRFDEIFFTDLPGKEARKDIFRIHLVGKGKNDALANNDVLIKKTEGFSGSEIEAVVNEALFLAFDENKKECNLQTEHLLDAAEPIVPLSATMGEQITNLREWAKNRCRPASEDKPPTMKPKGGPQLRAENSNPFMDES